MVRSLGVTKKLAFQFENILPIRCSPTFYSIVRSALKNVAGFLRFRSREAEIQAPRRHERRRRLSERTAASRRMLGGRSSCGLSRGATRSTQAVPVGIETREVGLNSGSEPIA